MKKTNLTLLAVLALVALPMAAMAAVSAPATPGAFEFTLGGFVKMEADWDSTQMNKNITTPVARNNNLSFHHGRLKATAEGTRISLGIKGPKLFGAQVTGLVEFDFDQNFVATASTTRYTPTLRHAMFRLNWPETELLFGQYWGFVSEFVPEAAQDGANQFTGSPVQRMPQVRVTQKFLDAYTAAFLIARPGDPTDPNQLIPNPGFNPPALQNTPGASAEGLQLQGKLTFQQDLWGKAAFYGAPRPFTAQVVAGWQKSRWRSSPAGEFFAAATVATFGHNRYWNPAFARQRDQQYLDHWIVQGALFIPVIPTYSANLAGTASLQTQWCIGQGLSVFGEALAGDDSFLMFSRWVSPVNREYDRVLMRRFTGYVQGQYYFTNQWYMNLVWGMSRAFGISRDKDPSIVQATNPEGFKYLTNADQTKLWQVLSATVWYRPITSIKFGLQYSFARTDWLQRAGPVNNAFPAGRTVTDYGDNHRVMFAGFFFF